MLNKFFSLKIPHIIDCINAHTLPPNNNDFKKAKLNSIQKKKTNEN